MKDVLYSVRRCILEYLGLEVMEPFVAYAAPRVDAGVRAEYLRSWEARLLAAVGDQAWHAHLSGLADTAAQNRMGSEEKAWAAPRQASGFAHAQSALRPGTSNPWGHASRQIHRGDAAVHEQVRAIYEG
jgi:hypothetical protein